MAEPASVPSVEVRRYAATEIPGAGEPLLAWAWRYPALVWRHRYLVWSLYRIVLLGRFRGSFLGLAWALIQPLFLFAVYYVVFGILFAPRGTSAAPDAGYAVYLFAGVLAWTAFSGAATRSCEVITNTPNLVRSAAFPAELLPLPLVLTELTIYAAGALILVLVGLLTATIQLGAPLLALPLLLVLHVSFTLGLAMVLATVNVFVRDIGHAYAILSVAWFFLSPVIWGIDLIEARLGALAPLVWCNPAYPLLQLHRDVLGVGSAADIGLHLGLTAFWASIFMTLGYRVCMRHKHRFADLI